MALADSHRRFMVKQTSIATLTNFVMGGVMAWVVFRSSGGVQLWGGGGVAFDTVATIFFLTFFTSFFVSKGAYKAVRQNRVPPLYWPAGDGLFQRVRPRPLVGSLAAALVVAFVVAPIVIGVFWLLGADVVDVVHVVVFKAALSASLALGYTPIVVFLALAETSWLESHTTADDLS